MKNIISVAAAVYLICFSAFPQSAQLLKGKEAYDNGKYEEAVRIFGNHLLADPSNYNVHGYYINSLIGLKKYDEAVSASEKAIGMFPSIPDLMLVQAKLYIMLEKYQKAKAPLSKYVKIKPDDKNAKEILGKLYQNIAIGYYQRKEYEDAADYFLKALPFDAHNEDLHYNVISLLIGTKRLKDAQRELESAMRKFPGSAKFNELYSDVLIETKQYGKTVAYLERLTAENPGNMAYILKLGLAYRYNSEPDKSIAFYDKMIEKYPDEKELYLAKVGYYSLYSEYGKIRKIYSQMAERLPDKIEWKKKFASTFKDEGKPDSARYFYKQIFLKDTADANLLITVAKLFTEEKNDSAAIRQLEEIEVYDPSNFNMFNLLHELYVKHSYKEKALASGAEFYKRYPYHHLASYSLGKAYLVNAVYDSALKYLNISKRLNSKYVPSVFEAAAAHSLKGEQEEASAGYKIAVDRCLSRMVTARGEAMRAISNEQGNIDLAKIGNIEYLNSEVEVLGRIFDSSFAFLRRNLPDQDYTGFLDRKLELYPSEVSLIEKKAEYFESNEKMSEAVTWYGKALFLNSNYTSAHLALAGIYERTKDYAQAVKSWKRVLSIEPKNSSAYDALIRLSEKSNTLNELCNEWLSAYSVSKDPVLKERLIEALHKAGRRAEAREIL